MIIKNGIVLTEEGVFVRQDMACDTHITALGKCQPEQDCGSGTCNLEEVIDASQFYVVPGLVDIHTHGGMGMDASDGNPDALDILSKYYASQGVTSWCPTTMTLQEDKLTKAVTLVRDYQSPVAAKPAGVYLEGPFFHYDKRGAQSAKNLAEPDFDMFQRLETASGNNISVLALAPELKNAMDVVEKASKSCTVAMGHTTADYDTAQEAFGKGATLATHLFNGMPAFAHRSPGVIGAAFDSEAYAELICDGLHIHPSAVRVAHKLFGERLCLISDSLRCAGMPDGPYELGGQAISKVGNKVTLADGTLAGSVIGLLDGVNKVISFGISPEDALYAASTAPACAIGKQSSIGSLSVGKCADFLLLDQDFQLISTFVDGKKVFQAET